MTRFASVAATMCVLASLTAGQDLQIAKTAARCDSEIPWSTDGFAAPDPGGPIGTLPPATRPRPAILEEALKRAGDEKKLVFWYVTRLEGVQMYRSGILDEYLKVIAFTDRRIVKLLPARFVPVRMALERPLFERLGVKPLDWIEPAFLVLTPDGKVVKRLDRIRTFNADWFVVWLKQVLRENAAAAPAPDAVRSLVDAAAQGPEQALKALDAAEDAGWNEGVEQVAATLAKSGGAKGDLMARLAKAALLMETFDAGAVLEELALAEKAAAAAGAPDDFAPLFARWRGAVALKSGALEDAQKTLAEAAKIATDPADKAAALYQQATAEICLGQTRKAEQIYRELATTLSDQRQAWQAASNLVTGRDTTPVGPGFHAFDDPFWPPKEAVSATLSGSTTAWARTEQDTPDVAKRALAFLLRRQNSAGGWTDARYAYWSTPRLIPNAWTAISAAAACALLDWRAVDPEAVDKALKKAERFLYPKKDNYVARGQNEECYADAFRMLYLAKKLRGKASDPKADEADLKRLNDLVKALQGQLSEGGFFAHEYPNPFTTGAVAVALDHARHAGATVPDSMFQSIAKGLRSTRAKNGAFAYGAGGPPRGPAEESLKNSMARSPVCERALMFAGQDSPDALVAALDNWNKFLPRFDKVRVCDFHSDGELAGFFFWHAAYFTTEAIKGVPSSKRATYEKVLRDHLLSVGEFDGSFIDSHEIGKSYGTAMALMTLRNLTAEKRP